MELNIFKPGAKENGHISSVSSGKQYKTLTEALYKGRERKDDCRVEWEFDVNNATRHNDIDRLFDEQFLYLRERYDLLELSWGGGYDSSYLLEVAYRNNIQIDIISMMGIGTLETEHGQNKEFHWNYKHVERYLEKFPKTEIKFMDFNTMWRMMKDQDWDWTQSRVGLDDICGFAGDQYLDRKASDNRALITGRGWKKIIHNKEYDCWSLFHPSSESHMVLCYSSVCDIVYFFGTPDIIMTQCAYARDLAMKEQNNQNIWVSDSDWMQQKVLYKKMPFGIRRFPKWTNEFNHPKMAWFCQNSKPVEPILHKKYWDYLSDINKTIHPDNLKGAPLPDGLWDEIVKTVDF